MQITFEIKEDGTIVTDVVGAEGTECDIVKFLDQAGELLKEDKKPEYYETKKVRRLKHRQRQRNRR